MIRALAAIAPTLLAGDEIGDLCRACGVRRLDLFGSAAVGAFDPSRSDLDFLVDFTPEPPGGYANAFFRLHEGLTVLFRRPIDLVTERSLENPYLRAQVLVERRTVFEV